MHIITSKKSRYNFFLYFCRLTIILIIRITEKNNMKIEQEKLDGLVSTIRIDITKDDYYKEVETLLKKYQRTASMPGFRPGKVPMSIVKKMYEKPVVADEVQKLLINSLDSYVKDNNLMLIGSPLSNTEIAERPNIDEAEDYSFYFDLGLVSAFNIELENLKEMKLYKIKASEAIIDEEFDNMLAKNGKVDEVEESDDKCMLRLGYQEKNEDGSYKEDSISGDTSLLLSQLKKKETVEKLCGLKKGDSITLDLLNDFENQTEYKHSFMLKDENIETFGPLVELTVNSITKYVKAEPSEELFVTAFGDDVKTEEDAKAKIKEQIEKHLATDASAFFLANLKEKLLKETQVDFSEDFLKRIIRNNSEKEINDEEMSQGWDDTIKAVKWQMIADKISEKYHIEVSEDLIKANIRNSVLRYFLYNQQGSIPNQEKFEQIVDNMMNDESSRREAYQTVFNRMLTDIATTTVPTEKEEVSYEQFQVIMEEFYPSKKDDNEVVEMNETDNTEQES